MAGEDPEAFLRAMLAPLSRARPGGPLPGVPFAREAVANAFVMLGLLPEARAEEILAGHRAALEAKGFRFGVLTGELSVRPGAHGYQDALATGRDGLTGIPLAVAERPTPIPGGTGNLTLTGVTVTPGGTRLRLRVTGLDEVPAPRWLGLPFRVPPSRGLMDEIGSTFSVTDDLGRTYRLQPRGGHGTLGQPGGWWEGELLAKPEARAAGPAGEKAQAARGAPTGGALAGEAAGGEAPAGGISWLEFAWASGAPVRVVMSSAASVETGAAQPPWPTPAEGYLAQLASAGSMTIGTDSGTVELDTARIVAAVADALLRTGALPPDSALLSGGKAALPGWREELKLTWGRPGRDGQPDRAVRVGLATGLPLRRATAVIESIAAHGDQVSVQLYGHPWVSGEYWPMITPCFQVRAVDDTGAGHEGVPGSGGGAPEASYAFRFWPPVASQARRIRVIVSTLWEAAWAEVAIPGRDG